VLGAGLLDEVLVHIVPVLLGDGVRLFERPDGTPVLEPVSFVTVGETTVLRYAPSTRR
jgi:riboflavin biosynthesis pyrimidine reductase